MNFKHKYKIGDVVMLKNTTIGKVGIITHTYSCSWNGSYNILVCGDPVPMAFWEDDIEGKIE